MQDKIQLFRKLFAGRTDVIPRHWQSKDKQGYTPICNNEWDKELCSKPCHSCKNQDYIPLNDKLITAHLSGGMDRKLFLMGCYPLLDGNLCNFIAGDFDNHDGERDPLSDIQAMAEVCSVQELPFYACLSKSGKGYHGYWFFDESIEAWKARAVYFGCLEEAGIISDNDNISSFDRLFPNQDKLSGRGFGNLIALPLHRINLGVMNQPSRFLTPESNYTKEYQDQWAALQEFDSNRISLEQIENLIEQWDLKPAKKIKKTGSTKTYSHDDEKLDIDEILKGNIPKGQRDTLIFKYACRLREKGLTQQEAEIMCCNLVDKCEQSADDKYTHDEAITKVISAWKYEPSEKKPELKFNPDTMIDMADLPYSDVGRADVFLKSHGENLKFSYTHKQWVIWDGKQWIKDEKGKARGLAKNTAIKIANSFRLKADGAENKTEKSSLASMATTSESRSAIDNFLNLSQSDVAIDINVFNQDKFLFNCQNGVFDLQNNNLLPHDKIYLMSKISPVIYDPDARSELWENFLETILPKQEKREFLQRYLGYCLSGDTTEQKFLIATGTGSNGKSVINEVISYILGDYADIANTQSFSEQKIDAIREDLAGLKSARFVSTSEPKERMKLDISIMKSLTGDHAFKCRFLHQNSFTYFPEFKIFYICNQDPIVTSQDHGTWRRILRLLFNVTIPDDQQDANLPEKLKAESSAILNWLIEGFSQWQKQGLNAPESVLMATKDYRTNSDTLADFFNDKCIIGNEYESAQAEFFIEYKNFTIESGQKPFGKQNFNNQMRERGFFEKKSGVKKWIGIGLTEKYPSNDPKKGTSAQTAMIFNETANNESQGNIDTYKDNGSYGQFINDKQNVLYVDKENNAHDSARTHTHVSGLSVSNGQTTQTDINDSKNNPLSMGKVENQTATNCPGFSNCPKCQYYVPGYETCLLARQLNKKIILCSEFKKECKQYI